MQLRDRIKSLRRVKASELRPNPKNWRTHPESQQNAMRSILAEVGIADAVLARETPDGGLMLIDGHLRAEVAPDAKLPVLVLDVTEAEADKILLTHDVITELAEPNAAMLAELLAAAEFEAAELDAMTAAYLSEHQPDATEKEEGQLEDVEPQINRAAELQKKWKTKRGQLWTIEGEQSHRLLCGDSTSADDVKRCCGGASIDLVWTDPPYGVAIGDKNKHLNTIGPSNRVEVNLSNDTLDASELLEMLRKAFASVVEICRRGASWYVAAPAGPLHLVFGQALNELGIWRQTIQWVKNNATFSPMGVSYHWQCEPIFYGWLPGAAKSWFGGRKQTTVWQIDRPLASPLHPTMKPLELMARAMSHTTRPGERVCDPFCGSGSTMLAAEQLERKCYGVEIDPNYVAVILERMTDAGCKCFVEN